MRICTFLFFTLLVACASPKKYQTYDYHRLAQEHKTIAILPIVFENKRLDSDLSEDMKAELMTKENDFVQNALYQRLTKDSGINKKDIKIRIEPISTTNQKLAAAGIDILHLEKSTDLAIAAALKVDAVLRTKISTAIMLHSTKYDLPKEILSTVRFQISNPVVRRAIDLNVEPVFLSSEIIDQKEATPIWVYSKKRELEVHDKNTDLLKWLCGDLVKRFPYRE